jgi:hypothetical protein
MALSVQYPHLHMQIWPCPVDIQGLYTLSKYEGLYPVLAECTWQTTCSILLPDSADAVDKVCNECGTAVQITGEAEATLRIPTVGQQQQYDSVPLFVTAEAIMHAMRYSMTTAVGMFTSGNKTDIYHDTAAEVRCKLAHFQLSTTFSCKHASHVCPTSI